VTADPFECHRSHVFGVAYRMLGSRVEAEDAVQETWLRYAGHCAEVVDLRGWLTTVVARICLDVLRSARVRRDAYVGPWLPEPLVARLPGASAVPDPGEAAVRDEQVGLALLVVLERLSPEQRLAFVLHDVFAVPFDAIGTALGTSTANARQLAARGRRIVRATHATAADVSMAEQRRVLAAFVRAADAGDLLALARVLAPDVELVGDGGGLAPSIGRPLVGFEPVSRFVIALYDRARQDGLAKAELVAVNGMLGFLIELSGQLTVIAPHILGGRVVALYHIRNPDKLRYVDSPDPRVASWPPFVQAEPTLN
jgi:RNA polymerase sigma-70 factor, ECF subfamily